MNKEKIINEVNEVIKDICDLLDEEELITFKKELDKSLIIIKAGNDLIKKLDRVNKND